MSWLRCSLAVALLLIAACTTSTTDPNGGDEVTAGDNDSTSGDAPAPGDGPTPGDTRPVAPCALQTAFRDLLDEADAAAPAARQALVDQFLTDHGPDFPYVEGNLATFIYTGSATNVGLPSDINNWSSAPIELERLPDTNLFHLTYCLETNARIDYKFIINGSDWILDPRNPFECPGGFGTNSELRMPDWLYPTEIDYDSAVPHGTVEGPTTFHSDLLDNDRNLWVYLPPGYDAEQTYPTLYVNDGGEYVGIAQMANVLDNLLATGGIEPLIVIFVDPVNRGAEYVGAQVPLYVRLVVEELVPHVDGLYATRDDPVHRGVMGTSNGGYISVRLGRDHPEVFTRLGSQSGALGADYGAVISDFATQAVPAQVAVYLECGDYDLPGFCDYNRSLRDALEAHDYAYSYSEYPEGHSWGSWRAHLDELLTFLFPG